MALDLLAREENIIFTPGSLSASDPRAVLSLCSRINQSTDEVVLDAAELKFIDPFGLAMLRATLESQPTGKRLWIRWMPQELITYLVRMDFFEGLTVEGIDTQSARNPQGEPDHCVELIRVQQGNSEEIASRLIQAMTGMENSEDEELNKALDDDRRPIEYALKELLENALSHAKKDGNLDASAWVACQHFESNGFVRLAIVDNGCGFLETLKGHELLKEKTHLAAIEAALTERVSCNRGPTVAYETDSQNQGVGLTTTARIAEAAGGLLVVASGDAWIRTDCGAQEVMEDCSWKGVAIAFSCHRDKLHLVKISDLLPKAEAVADDEISFE